jgi:hypothetical protein
VKTLKLVCTAIRIILVAPALLLTAQVPTGTIIGAVTDPHGAVVVKARVSIINKDTGASRVVETKSDGSYSAPSLSPGNYAVRAEAPGLTSHDRTVEVLTGATIPVNFEMKMGTASESVEVTGTAGTIDPESNTIQGVVALDQIENLPLNGRSFLNLAQLEPGVTVNPGNPAQFNAQFNVSVLGGPASHTAITVDGANIRNPVEGGTGQNFSQEVVKEFQISSTNFDLSTGITAFGAINVVTRSGGNGFHGAGYFYFRDHNMAAYPSLKRNSITDDPFFARRQGGVTFSGPIKKNRAFFFFNFENTNQTGVYVVAPDLPSVSAFATLAPAPYTGRQYNGKLDYRINEQHSLFARYSHDGNRNSGPFTAAIPTVPSNYVSNKNWVDQYELGASSMFRPTLVNDFRFSYQYWQNRNLPATCGGCVGQGGPEVFYLNSVNFAIGNNFNSPQGRDLRRFPVSDNVSWQKGNHRVKFGGEWEHFTGTGYWGFFDPARAYLLSPEFLEGVGLSKPIFLFLGIPLPIDMGGSPLTAADLNKLPVAAFLLGIGDPAQPSFRLDNAKTNERFHLYAQDTWKIKPTFTLNFGSGWEHETNVLNYDLAKPAFLAPIYGSDLNPTRSYYKNFEPAVGFAWSLNRDRTVIRGGAGIFYDTQLGWWRLGERAVLGGSGRQFIGNAAVINPTTGQPFSSGFLNSLAYRYGTFLAQLPTLRAQQNAKFPGTGDQPQILLSKQANALGALYPRDFPTTQAQHFNLGVQHELGKGFLVQSDFVYRHMIHGTPGSFFGTSVDFNHFNSLAGPAIPRCTAAQSSDPAAACSNGPINFWWPGATSQYKALLVKVDKRFSHRFQLTASYALQDSQSIGDVTQNLNNFFATYGPDSPHHNLNISGFVDLPWGFQVSLLSAFQSHPPVAPTIGGVNNAGTDVSSGGYTPLLALLGKGYSGFISSSDLRNLANQYNSTIGGTLTPAGQSAIPGLTGQKYPFINLPADFNLSEIYNSQDIRVSKTFSFRERYRLRLIGEGFNIFNTSNVSNFNLTLPTGPVLLKTPPPTSAFGQPNQRIGQTFGSGGPRAFQIAARVMF